MPNESRRGFRLTPHLEIRQRYESQSNYLQRYMPSLTAEWDDDLVLFAQLKSALSSGRIGGPRPIDLDHVRNIRAIAASP